MLRSGLRRAGLQGLCLCSLLYLFILSVAVAAPLSVPPLSDEAERVDELLTSSPELSNRYNLAVRHHLSAGTNVMPLAWGNRKRVPTVRFIGEHASFQHATNNEMWLCVGHWRLRYASGLADNFEGSPGAAQLYLDSRAGEIDLTGNYIVRASLNRTALNRWTLEHRIPVKMPQGNVHLTLGASWLVVRRVQQGQLRGEMHAGQFDGNLLLDSTRGLPSPETTAQGMMWHLSAVAPVSERLRVGVWGEDLFGRVRGRRIQRVTARVLTDTVVPDADGFLHAAPLLHGRVDEFAYKLGVSSRWTVGAAMKQGSGHVLAYASHHTDWRYSIGYGAPKSWILFHLPTKQWQIAYFTGGCNMVIGMSGIDLSRTKHVTLSVRWITGL